MSKDITVFAPAKINLYLHITGKLSNGYHELDSLVTFADIGDQISVREAKKFSFKIMGEFAKDLKSGDDSNNLVIRAAKNLAQISNNNLDNIEIILEKNLPVASGIGGGSSDAAATIWALQKFWNLKHSEEYIAPLLIKLGSDVPVCQYCRPTIIRGIGDILIDFPEIPEIAILLVNPLISCSTQDIFLHYNEKPKCKNINIPNQINSITDLIKFLNKTDNDLLQAATKLIPEINNVINAINTQEKCLFTRMSGSGASCFGLFENIENAKKAAKIIKQENPDWWVRSGWLNRVERY